MESRSDARCFSAFKCHCVFYEGLKWTFLKGAQNPFGFPNLNVGNILIRLFTTPLICQVTCSPPEREIEINAVMEKKKQVPKSDIFAACRNAQV